MALTPTFLFSFRKPDRSRYGSGSSGHRRTASNSSAHRFGGGGYGVQAAPRKLSRQNSYTGSAGQPQQPPPPTSQPEMERPQTLELPLTPRTPARSSLKKTSSYSSPYHHQQQQQYQYHHGYHHQPPPPGTRTSTATNWSGSSGGGTPTNAPTTPPESLSDPGGGDNVLGPAPKTDSGFVSSRVRFSPSPFDVIKSGGGEAAATAYVTDWSPTHDPALGVPPHPLHSSGRAWL